MIFLYKNLVEKGYSDYQIKKQVQEKKLYMIKKGVYSTTKNYDYLEFICKKHPNAIITLQTACECYGILKNNQDIYYIATKQKDRKIKNDKLKQIFMTDSLYQIGAHQVKYKNYYIRIYDLERLLIEIVRNKINLDYDIYHKMINGYKKIFKLLNKDKLNHYITLFKDSKIKTRISQEVFELN